jgi:hypothetical protein
MFITVFTQLREALRECIQVPLASGRLEDLAEMFNDHGEQVNGKLKQLIGQVGTIFGPL